MVDVIVFTGGDPPACPGRQPLAIELPGGAQVSAPSRCWADVPARDLPNTTVPECQAIADGRVGLCQRHTAEILGPPATLRGSH